MIKKIKIKNKKAQIGSTLTWIVATLIIFFILIIFIISASFLSLKKEKIEPTKKDEIKSDLTSMMILTSFLKTEVSGTTMKDLILSSLDPYFEYKDYTGKTVLEKIGGDINKLEKEGYPPIDFYSNNPEAREKDKKIREEAKKILDSLCSEYYLKIPQGVISHKGPDFYARKWGYNWDLISKEQEEYWTSWSLIKIPYKGQVVEIKYRILEKC